MKKVMIEVRIPGEDKVGTKIETSGYRDESVSDQFELLGIMENIKNVIQERIRKIMDVRGNVKWGL